MEAHGFDLHQSAAIWDLRSASSVVAPRRAAVRQDKRPALAAY